MLKRLFPIITMLMLGSGIQAEENQETPKCPDDPSEFKGKEDDCFDCLAGAFDKLKEFTDEVGKMLDNKKLDSAEESGSLKTRSEGLWDGVEGWQKICNPNPESKEKPEAEEGEETKAETGPEGEAQAEAEAETEPEPEPQAEEAGETQADTEANPEPEAEPEEAGEAPEAETDTDTEAEPEAEAEAEEEPDANA